MSIKQNIKSKFLNENNVKVFRHKAMNTKFELYIADEEEDYAGQAAHEVFMEIDIIENDLSKFIPNSDISKINSLPLNETAIVGEHAFKSLEDCKNLYDITGGIFNVALGTVIDTWKGAVRTVNTSSANVTAAEPFPLIIDDTDFSITRLSDATFDLGGYGKGYTVDRAAELLKEWSIRSFLVSGGYSTVLAFDSGHQIQGWPVSISKPGDKKQLGVMSIQNIAVSSSGLEKGHHIIDPRNQQPPSGKAAWAACSNAAWSDAFSTAFLILDSDEVSKICNEHGISALLIRKSAKKWHYDAYGKIFEEL